MLQRRRPLRRPADLKARLWSRLRLLEDTRFRKGAPFKSFIFDFVDHEALLVIDLREGEPGRERPSHIARDRLLAEAGYTVLRLWADEAARDLDMAMRRIRAVLDDRNGPDSD